MCRNLILRSSMTVHVYKRDFKLVRPTGLNDKIKPIAEKLIIIMKASINLMVLFHTIGVDLHQLTTAVGMRPPMEHSISRGLTPYQAAHSSTLMPLVTLSREQPISVTSSPI